MLLLANHAVRLAESREHRATGSLPESGSVAAHAQSAADKQANLEHAEQHVKSKLEAGFAPTRDEAKYVIFHHSN